MSYLGIVIEQSLKDQTILSELTILGEKQIGGWTLLLVSVSSGEELSPLLQKLQNHMIDAQEDCWYAHFFSNEWMFIVYENALFETSLLPEDWDEAIRHGMSYNIPLEQLDFKPRTKKDVLELFGISENSG
ncbi:hypothetical protein [Fontibacillus sp. BL9]|uniref:hypothetical protein n=1 Tax=Fontibacillus sp. BL9 TaxID=3389971 RepID=UPI00397BFD5C